MVVLAVSMLLIEGVWGRGLVADVAAAAAADGLVPIMASLAATGQARKRRARLLQAQSRTAQVGSRSQAKFEGRIVSRRHDSG